MGFDLIGVKVANEKGKYFGNNYSWWRPLWKYVYEACKDILTEEDFKEGNWNNGYLIDSDKTIRIAIRLERLLNHGEVEKYVKEGRSEWDNLPDKVCFCCCGKGEMTYLSGKQGKCIICEGKGKFKAWVYHFPFDEDNVKSFVEFCRNSGGFRIW